MNSSTEPSPTDVKVTMIDALTGIRIIAASYVFIHHIGTLFVLPLFPDIWKYMSVFVLGGWAGVDLFFVLSGFIIAYNYFDSFQHFHPNYYWQFLVKRIARIYPVHLFCTLVILAYVLLTFPASEWFKRGDLNLSTLFQNFFLVQGWSLPTHTSWNSVSWSVSCEWLAYLFFPLLVLLITPIKKSGMLIGLIVVIYLCTCVAVAVGMQRMDPEHDSMLFGLIRIASEFTTGVVLYKLYAVSTAVKEKSTKLPRIALLLTLFVFITAWTPVSFLWITPYFTWLIWIIASGRIRVKFLEHPSMIYGGKISYSLYLVHGLVFTIFYLASEPALHADASVLFKTLYIAAYIILSIGITIFCYHCVEEPARKSILKKLYARVH